MRRSGQAKDVHRNGDIPCSKPVQGRPKIPKHATSSEGAVREERERILREDQRYRKGGK